MARTVAPQLERGPVPYEAAFWDRYFEHYDALERSPPYRDLLDRVAVLCDPAPGVRVLDAGAGTGNLGPRLGGMGADVVALDANGRGLLRARGKNARTRCVRASLDAVLPFHDGRFDAVAAVNVLYTLSDAGRACAISELRRVLGRDGRLVVSVPMRGAKPLRIYAETVRRWAQDVGLFRAAVRTARFLPPTVAILAANERIRRQAESGPYRFFSKQELVSWLEEEGFTVGGVERAYADQNWLVWASKR